MATVPEGVRNKNPGNIRFRLEDKWQGLAPAQPQAGGFCIFDDPVMGMRAIVRQLIAFQDKHDCRSVIDAITKYAPPSDNNPTRNYAANVARAIGVSMSVTVDWHKYAYARPALEAIITQENGAPWHTWYTSAQLAKACILAGVQPTPTPLLAHPQVLGSLLAGAAAAAPYLGGSAQSAAHLGIAAAFVAVFSKIRDRMKGIS